MTTEEILIKLGMDATRVEEGLRRVEEKVKDWSREQTKVLSGMLVGWAGIEGIKTAYEQTVEFADKIGDLSNRLGISTDAIQVWDFALRKNGGTIESATAFFEHLAIARDKALAGGEEGKKFVGYFKDLGITIDDLKTKRIDEIAEQMSEVFKAGDPQKLLGSIHEIGGKGAGEVIATLRDGIAEAREEAEKLGIVIDSLTIEKLKEAGDKAKVIGAQLRETFAPFFAWLLDQFSHVLYAIHGVGSALGAAVAVLMDNPTDFKGAFKAMREEIDAEHAKEDAENKTIADRAKAKPFKGGSEVTDPKTAEHNKAVELNKQSAELEQKSQEKSLSLEDRITYLKLRKNRLQEEFLDKSKSELEHAQARNDLAKVNLDLATQTAEKKQKDAEATKKINELQDRRSLLVQDRTEDLRASSYWTVEQLAKNPMWMRNGRYRAQDPYSSTAQRIEFLEQRAHTEARYGNRTGADADLKTAQNLRGWLEKEGVVKPDHHLESIDAEMKRIRTQLIELGVKIQDDPQ